MTDRWLPSAVQITEPDNDNCNFLCTVQGDVLLYYTCGGGGCRVAGRDDARLVWFLTSHSARSTTFVWFVLPTHSSFSPVSLTLSYVQSSSLILSSSILSCISAIYLRSVCRPHSPLFTHLSFCPHSSHTLLSFLTQCPLVIHLFSSHAPFLSSYNGYTCYSITQLDDHTITLTASIHHVLLFLPYRAVPCLALPSSALLCTTQPFICIIKVSRWSQGNGGWKIEWGNIWKAVYWKTCCYLSRWYEVSLNWCAYRLPPTSFSLNLPEKKKEKNIMYGNINQLFIVF